MGEMLGYTVDEMLGRHLFSFMDERGIEVAKQLLEHRRLGITEQHDFEFLKKDGSRIYVIIETSPITDEGGNYVGALAGVMDMTEHREMEKKLREYADNLETLVNERTEETRFLSNIASSIEQAVFVQDNDRGIIYVNKAFDDMYGYRAEGVIGRHASMLFPTVQDADRVNHEITESLENDGHWIGEAFKRRKNGEVFPILSYVSPLRDEEGKVVGRIIIDSDLTEKKEMERRLQASNEQLRRVFDNAPIGVIVADKDGKFIDVNNAMCRITEASREEILKLSHSTLQDKRIVPYHERAMRGEVCEYIGPYRTTISGIEVWWRVIFAPLYDVEGEVIGTVGLYEDITGKKNLEEKLHVSEERLRRIFDNASIGIIMTDAEGNHVEVNEAQCKQSQASREELLGQNFFQQKDRSLQPDFRKALSGEVVAHEGWYTTTLRGLTYWFRTVMTPLFGPDGRIDGVVIIWEDATERKRLEEQLLEQTSLASTGKTALMVGHDLRNPLQAIVNICYLAKKKTDSARPEDRKIIEDYALRGSWETVSKQADYMNKIVSDLQDYARPLKLKPVDTGLSHLIDDVLSMVTVPENIQVSKGITEAFPKLRVDPELMRRVFTNLVTNAVQAMSGEGKLTIEASQTGDTACISVVDTGCGIPGENMEKLFQPLFTTKAKGQGLGLPVCKRFVEAHGGEITVESEVGRGSTFTIRIPFNMEARHTISDSED